MGDGETRGEMTEEGDGRWEIREKVERGKKKGERNSEREKRVEGGEKEKGEIKGELLHVQPVILLLGGFLVKYFVLVRYFNLAQK